MILDDEPRPNPVSADARTTLDEIFRRTAARRPQGLALADAPNRSAFTDGAPRYLTFAQAEAAVVALADRLQRLGLPADSVVGVQLAHTVESIVTLLAVLRAGLIAAPLPLLWRRAECVAALSQVGAKALITCARVGETSHATLAMEVAAALFPVRYVCAFGDELPEGVIPLDDIFAPAVPPAMPFTAVERNGPPAAHLAAVTFDTTADGVVALARSHVELLAGGVAGVLEARMAPESMLLSGLPLSSFAGLALCVVPWLLTGGALLLHQPFDRAVLAAQLEDLRCDHAVLPGPLAGRLADAQLLSATHGLKSVLGVWRAPERLVSSPSWTLPDVTLIDVSVFGETALIAAARREGRPVPFAAGPVTAPYRAAGAVTVCEIARTKAGTLAFRGPMVPRRAFPPGGERTTFGSRIDEEHFIDTGFTGRIDATTRDLIVTGPPAGLVSVGGYRFSLRELQDEVARTDGDSSIAAFPDAFAGHRLAGQAADRASMREALVERGANPLLVRAFRDRAASIRPAGKA